jgi:D-inositol-3-phosphate glycosyltransferase
MGLMMAHPFPLSGGILVKSRIAMLSMHTSPLAAPGGKETGGMNVYVNELARHLGQRGWPIDIFTRQRDAQTPLIEAGPGEGCRTISLPAGPTGPVDRRALFTYLPAFVEGVRAFRAAEGVDYALLHSHYWLSGWAARELQREWGVPVVQMFHTLGKMKDAVADGPAQREAENRARVEQEILAFADRIVAATPLDRQQLLDLYQVAEDKIVVIPCGVNLERFHPMPLPEAQRLVGVPEGRRMFLFVGRLDPVKGLNVLLEAMCELTERLHLHSARDLSLAIIGGDSESHLEAMMDDTKCLQEIIRDKGLDDLVLFLGPRAQEQLPPYYAAAVACVMPSLYESFGMVALEAMACGTPVIASRVGGLTFTVRDGETGYLVPERDPKALADKLELLLHNECLRQRLGRRAAQVALGYSWEVVTESIEQLYAELGV